MKPPGAATANNPTFVDANIWIYWLAAHPTYGDACLQLVRQIEAAAFPAVINPLVLDEVTFGIAPQIVFDKTQKSSVKVLKRSLKEDHIFADIEHAVDKFTRFLGKLLKEEKVTIYPIDYEMYRVSLQLLATHRLTPRDCLHLATCKINRVTNFATYDSDFEKVDFITVVTP